MPTRITLDLTPIGSAPDEASATPFKASDYRVHGSPTLAERHWLLRHPYGHQFLVDKLKELRPDLHVLSYRSEARHEGLLDNMLDVLDLRDWPEPHSVGDRVRASITLLRYAMANKAGRKAPDWRAVYAKA